MSQTKAESSVLTTNNEDDDLFDTLETDVGVDDLDFFESESSVAVVQAPNGNTGMITIEGETLSVERRPEVEVEEREEIQNIFGNETLLE